MRKILLALVFMLLCSSLATADEDPVLAQMLGPSMVTCKLDGSWAACDVKTESGTRLHVFRQRGQTWERMGRGMGPMSAAMLLALGCPDDIVRGFGLGILGQETAKALRDAARGSAGKPDSFMACSLKSGFLARTFNASTPGVETVWRFEDGHWKPMFSCDAGADRSAVYPGHGLSPYVQMRLTTGRAVPLDSWTPDF